MPLPINVTFLGTSGSTPTKERNLPSVAIEYDGGVYIFDCGEGTQRQLAIYGISPARIKAIFITHMHGDHVIGVAGLVRTMALNKRADPLLIFVPKGEEKKVMPLLTFDKAMIGYPIIIKPAKSGVVMKVRGFSVCAFTLKHSIPTCGYYFKEEERYRFMKERCQKLGIKGTMFSEILKKGSIKINNKTIKLKDVATKEEGRKIVYAADTRPTKSTETASMHANLLIHEATYTEEFKNHARERMHSTAMEAAQVAKNAKVKRFIIFHMSARFKSADEPLKEARKIFKITEAAHDGMRVTL